MRSLIDVFVEVLLAVTVTVVADPPIGVTVKVASLESRKLPAGAAPRLIAIGPPGPMSNSMPNPRLTVGFSVGAVPPVKVRAPRGAMLNATSGATVIGVVREDANCRETVPALAS